MREDQAGKANGAPLPLVRLAQHICIEGDHHAIQLGRAIEQCSVTLPSAAIVLRRQDIDAANAQPHRNRIRHVLVHVERDRHRSASACLS
jgi:hypothetical protein